ALRLADQAAGFGAELREWRPVEHVGRRGKSFVIRTAEGEDEAKTLVLALGLGRFAPRRLGLPEEDRFLGKGLTYRLPPIEQIEAKQAVVVGGGDTALDTALSLKQVAEVTLVHRREEFSAYAFSQRKLADAGLDVITNGTVVGLRGDGRLQEVLVERGDGGRVKLPADLLLVSIGQTPDLAGIEQWELGLSGSHIRVDSAMRVDREGLFAVGDYATYSGKVRMIATAVAEGSTAASAAEMHLMSMS
ncbi:MAG: NAD(P)/FAD-dependent oxidoreductase, partial [Acidobacteria bacterium]